MPTSAVPRRSRHSAAALAVFRSLEHIYGQIIDDIAGATLVAASDLEPSSVRDVSNEDRAGEARRPGPGRARQGEGDRSVVFDRGGFSITGGSRPWPMVPARRPRF